jgi:hypothetical protein
MMRSAILLLSLLTFGESLKLDPKKRKFTEEHLGEEAKAQRAALKEDKTGGNEICKARMGLFGEKLDLKAVSKVRQETPGDMSATDCHDLSSNSKTSAKDSTYPEPSTDDVEFGGIIYITLGGERGSYIKKHANKHANGTAVYKQQAGGPPASMDKLLRVSTGKDSGSLSQYNKATISATRAVYLSHMDAIERVAELTEDPEDNRPWLILEDDTKMVKDWKEKSAHVIKNTPADWDMIKTGYWAERRCSDRLNAAVFAPSTPTATNGQILYMGNQGYLVRPKSVPTIVEAMKKRKVADVDESFVFASCRARKEGSIKPCMNLYAASKNYMAALHKSMGSDRWSGNAGDGGGGTTAGQVARAAWSGLFGLHKNLEPHPEEPWKDEVTAENYVFQA